MKLAIFFIALLTAGCVSNQPLPRTEVVNTACTTFAIIKIPSEDMPKISDILKSRILAHDRAWVKECSKG